MQTFIFELKTPTAYRKIKTVAENEEQAREKIAAFENCRTEDLILAKIGDFFISGPHYTLRDMYSNPDRHFNSRQEAIQFADEQTKMRLNLKSTSPNQKSPN